MLDNGLSGRAEAFTVAGAETAEGGGAAARWGAGLWGEYPVLLFDLQFLEVRDFSEFLWGDPFLPVGCLCLDHTLGPGSDVPSAVIRIALEDQLA